MYSYDDSLSLSEYLIILVVIGFCIFGIKGCIAKEDANVARQTAWCVQHHTTYSELCIFAKVVNVNIDDIINSEGLQAEFERFENGNLRQIGQETIHHGKHTETRNIFQ